MMRSRSLFWLVPLVLTASQPEKDGAAVYLKLASTPIGSFDNTLEAARSAVQAGGWTLLADYEAGVNRAKCAYRTHVVVANAPAMAQAAVSQKSQGAFAAQVRLNVFEDETGVHVTAVNPRSIARTVVAEDGRDAEFAQWTRMIEQVVHSRIPGKTTEFGQFRDKGRIGKTMGIMAGGPFDGKIETIYTDATGGRDMESFARHLHGGLDKLGGNGEWKLHPVFMQHISRDIIVLGITGNTVESRSFDIVKAGGDDSRQQMKCPGIDHAAAYPLELVLVRRGDAVDVQMINEMFRMKMYFEDAGKMAFAKNMGMPGSIQDELKLKVRNALRAVT